ncbi:DUF2961 domain-containing protein [Agromyces intestinalis]|uniref:DUF2961 domain-containing protein n=1 Tax=Agromyces intestinalis TaxID=2592652 RepID=A0A5C1YJ69_9MICO|nr:glycoside hydrolase family 172 protein [Agromyces intestinalis]QEO15575.1 DUF2961 domain-containing protein [Agromyces intestinalis]
MVIDIARRRQARTRSFSPENPTGAASQGGRALEGPGAWNARELGAGWKISPCVDLPAGETLTLAELDGPGAVTHLWATTARENWRSLVLRAYWDGDAEPAVEVPYGDFFCNGWGVYAPVASEMIVAAPYGGFTSYWPMPFRRSARLTLENVGAATARVFYQVDVEEGGERGEDLYLHAQWRRSNPVDELVDHVLVDVTGAGHYAGTYLAWGSNSNGWWGEGEVKFFLDDDAEYPSICGTGTEDYFGGAWNFDVPGSGYTAYTTAYLGLPQIIRPDGLYQSQQRFGMYRWHLPDPICFEKRLRSTVQALGWQSGERYLPLRDDLASTALFYLDRTAADRPELDVARLEAH